MRTWTHEIDKTAWGEGPWVDEPDKAVWVDEATGLDCMIHRAPITGALCGYAGVPEGHQLHGTDYAALDMDVHGGLTYSAPCQEVTDEAHGICHTVEGRPANVWWFGFDTSHFLDYPPAMLARERELFGATIGVEWGHYKTFDYVKAEVERLAAQLV